MSRSAERATRVSAGNPAECHLLARMGMKRTAPAIARVAVCVALAAWAGGLQEGNARRPGCGRRRTDLGVGARGASGGGGRGRSHRRIGAGLAVAAAAPAVGGWSPARRRARPCVARRAETGASTPASPRSRPSASPIALREECDGGRFDGAELRRHGFPSGKLVCDKTCSHQQRGMFGVRADGAVGGQLRHDPADGRVHRGATPSPPPTARSGSPRLATTIPAA